MADEKDSKKSSATQIGIHSVRNILGHPSQLSLFSDQHTKFSSDYGIEIDKSIDRFGIGLTDIQMRVMEGILRGFSETNYKGNIAPEDKENIAHQKYSGRLPDTYKYVREIPRLRITQKQLIEWSGLSMGSAGDKQRALEALSLLGTKQYCFYYDRLALSEDGIPERDKNGNWKKEIIKAVDTLFTIKEVREEVSPKGTGKAHKIQGDLKYYEITPSAIFLDQRESYFMLIPYNWREEVDALYEKRKFSSYIPKFLYFLRFQYEMKRRSKNQERPYQIRWSPEEVAIALKMPKSVYNTQKERMNKILEEAYSVGKKLGYLQSYERTETVDILTLQDTKYGVSHSPSLEKAIGAMSNNTVSPAQTYLFDLFHKKKKEINHYHEAPEGQEKEDQLTEFNLLLAEKKPQEIEELIKWGLSQKFWCTRLSTPSNLRSNFDDAWAEMNVSKKQSGGSAVCEENKKIAQALRELITHRRKDVEIDLQNTYIEVRKSGTNHAFELKYTSKDFRKKVEEFLHVLEIPLQALGPYIAKV